MQLDLGHKKRDNREGKSGRAHEQVVWIFWNFRRYPKSSQKRDADSSLTRQRTWSLYPCIEITFNEFLSVATAFFFTMTVILRNPYALKPHLSLVFISAPIHTTFRSSPIHVEAPRRTVRQIQNTSIIISPHFSNQLFHHHFVVVGIARSCKGVETKFEWEVNKGFAGGSMWKET